MEVKSKIQKLFPSTRDTTSNHNQNSTESQITRVNSQRKTQMPITYTYYQSQKSIKGNSNPNQKKQYRYVSDQIQQYRRKSYTQLIPTNTENNSHMPEHKNQKNVTQINSSYRYVDSSENKQGETLRKTFSHHSSLASLKSGQIRTFSKNKDNNIEPTLVESKVLNGFQSKGSGYSSVSRVESGSNIKIYRSDAENNLISQNTTQHQNNQQRQKILQLEEQYKNIEKRNYDLAQQLLQSQTTIRQHEKTKKQFEDSLKISRNIITSLNERIARTKKQNQAVIHNLKSQHQSQLTTFQVNKQQQLKIAQTQIFELKMKIIDLTQQHEKYQQNMQVQFANRLQNSQVVHKQKKVELEGNIIKLNESNANMETQLHKIKGQLARYVKSNEQLTTALQEAKVKEGQQVINSVKQIQYYQEKIKSIEAQIAELRSKSQNYEDILQEKDSNIAQLKCNLTKAQLEIIQQKKLIKKSSKVSEQSLESSRVTVNYQAQISVLKQTIDSLELKLKEYQQKESKWQSEISAFTQKINDLSQQYQVKLQVKETSISMLTQIVETKDQEVNRMITINENISQQVGLKQQQIDKQQNQIDKKQEQMDKLMNENKQLYQQLQQVVEQKNQIQEYILQLQQVQKQVKNIASENNKTRSEGQLHNPKIIQTPTKQVDSDQQPSIQTPKAEPITMEQWLQQMHKHSRDSLVTKIQQLYFINKSLTMKVEDINDIENDENTIIMNKLKLFQENIQKYEQEINQLYEQNGSQKLVIEQLKSTCMMHEGRIQFLDSVIRQTQFSLLQTSEQLIKAQIQLVNLRFDKQKLEKQSQMSQEIEENINQIDQMIKQMENDKNNELQIEDRYDLEEQSHSDCENVNLQQKIVVEKQPKFKVSSQKQDSPAKSSSSLDYEKLMQEVEEQQRQLRQKMAHQSQQNQLQQIQRQLIMMQQAQENQVQYQVDQNGLGDVVFSIKVSHVSSDSDQEDEFNEKIQSLTESPSPKKQEQLVTREQQAKKVGQVSQNHQSNS